MNKKAVLSSFLLAFTSLATASHGGSGGLIGLISNFPFPVDNWRQIAISAATFGLIWFTVYMIVKKLVTRFELEELFNMGSSGYGGGDEGRNLGAVLSLLIVVSAAGASHNYLGFTIDSIQQLLLLGIGFLVLSLAIFIIGGGSAAALWTTGKSGKALSWGKKEFAEGTPNVDGDKVKKQVGKVGDVLSRAESEEKDVASGNSGNPEEESDEAAHDIQSAIELLQNTEQSLSAILKKDLDDFDKVLRDAEQVIDQDQKEEKGVRDIKGRMDEINDELDNLNRIIEGYPEEKGAPNASQFAGGIGTFNGSKGFNQVLKDIQAIEKDLQMIESLEAKEEEELEDEVHILTREYKDFKTLQKLLKKLQQEIGEAEQLDSYLEDMSQELGSKKVYGEAEEEEKELRQIESYYKNLTNKEGELESLIERAENLLQNEIQMEEEEIQQLKTLIQEEGPIFNQLSALEDNIDRKFGDEIPKTENKLRTAENELYDIRDHLEKIEKKNEQEEQAEERILDKLTGGF